MMHSSIYILFSLLQRFSQNARASLSKEKMKELKSQAIITLHIVMQILIFTIISQRGCLLKNINQKMASWPPIMNGSGFLPGLLQISKTYFTNKVQLHIKQSQVKQCKYNKGVTEGLAVPVWMYFFTLIVYSISYQQFVSLQKRLNEI